MYAMIAMHVWLSSGSSRCACLDLDHAGVAYLVTEYHKANACVLIVLAFVPYLEFAQFSQEVVPCGATFIFVFCMSPCN